MALCNTIHARIKAMATEGETADAWLALARMSEGISRIARAEVGDRKLRMPRQARDKWRMPAATR